MEDLFGSDFAVIEGAEWCPAPSLDERDVSPLVGMSRDVTEKLEHSDPLRFVEGGSDAATAAHLAARIFVAADGGPIRTLVGDYHRHFIGEEHSAKTGLTYPYDGATERALIVESELRPEVLTFRTQAFRIRFPVGNATGEWICDHLRQIRMNGVEFIEAIECKPNMSFLGEPFERAKLNATARIIKSLGWRFRVLYERDIVGGGERQMNFGQIFAHNTVVPTEQDFTAFEALRARSSQSTFGELRRALHENRYQGSAKAHAMICRGRVKFDLDQFLFDGSPIELLPAPEFANRIWF